MIQRYSMTNDYGCGYGVTEEKDDQGEWVKWEDIKHLMPFQEKLEEYLEKETDIILNGDPNAPKPKGIIDGGFK